MCEETTLKLEEVTELLDKSYTLVYVDYRDNLDESLDAIQAAIQKQDWEPLDSCVNDEWLWDSEAESVDYILKHDLPDDMVRAFDIEEEEAEDFIEENRDAIKELIYERDNSTPLDDLLRHTSDPVCFYDTGLYIDEPYNEEDVKRTLHDIKKVMGIKQKDRKYDTHLRLMIEQASYGGRFVVYFRMPIEQMMNIKDNNVVRFNDPMVAIIDTFNGSGDHTDLPDLETRLPLDTSNIFIDKTIKYSYTYSVCGMSSNWADCTNVHFEKKKTRKQAAKSSLHSELDREAEYNKTYKAGGCTSGDMDMRRHRDTFYLNDFPCGTHCPHCHTFWID